jgi:hypothetical protein
MATHDTDPERPVGSDPGNGPPVVPGEGDARPAAHGWAGWVVFAGVLLILLGAGHVIEGLVALAGGGSDGVLLVSSTTWGWVSVVLGIIGGLVGLGLLAGAPVARVLGVLLALVSAVVNLAALRDSPAAAVVVAVDVVVVYAITVHGGELRSTAHR